MGLGTGALSLCTLDEAQYLLVLKESAAKYNTGIAGVVRNLIDREMGGGESVKEDDPLFRMASSAVRTGRLDGSTDHDRYIYRQRSNPPVYVLRVQPTKKLLGHWHRDIMIRTLALSTA
ncbi:MAG TPA: hypothetical protein GX506_02280 [Firmicutes bacterium]|nr:hypothetical protein [Bacillota bacterium]